MRELSISLFFIVLICSATAALPDTTQIDAITLERTSCFGTCPVYKVTVRRDGSVAYDGKQFVRVTGHRTHKIPAEQFQKLAREIQRIGFFNLKDKYSSKENPDGSIEVVTDQPSRITTVRAGKLHKRVENYYGGPESLTRLETLIDTLAGSSAWTGRELLK